MVQAARELALRRDVYSVRLAQNPSQFPGVVASIRAAATYCWWRTFSSDAPLCDEMTVEESSSSLLRMSCARVHTLSA